MAVLWEVMDWMVGCQAATVLVWEERQQPSFICTCVEGEDRGEGAWCQREGQTRGKRLGAAVADCLRRLRLLRRPSLCRASLQFFNPAAAAHLSMMRRASDSGSDASSSARPPLLPPPPPPPLPPPSPPEEDLSASEATRQRIVRRGGKGGTRRQRAQGVRGALPSLPPSLSPPPCPPPNPHRM